MEVGFRNNTRQLNERRLVILAVYLVHFSRNIVTADIGLGVSGGWSWNGDTGLCCDPGSFSLLPPPLILHALLSPQQLLHVGPAARRALLEGWGPEGRELDRDTY